MEDRFAESEIQHESESPDAREREHLRTLAIFHYILGGLTFLVAGMFVVHLVLGSMAMAQLSQGERDRLPAGFGDSFNSIGIIGIVGGWSLAALNGLSGWCLARHKFRALSLFVAVLNLAWPPVGTGLGVITLIVLAKNSVRALYLRQPTEGTA